MKWKHVVYVVSCLLLITSVSATFDLRALEGKHSQHEQMNTLSLKWKSI